MRRTLYITLAWLLHISTVCGQPRCVSSLNSGWMFSPGDSRTEWQAANLPHSFSIPYFLSKDFYVGYGWYRKGLTLNTDDMKRRLSIEFDGVFQVAEVYVNGSKAGEHRGGYTGFEIDITPFVHKGENEISVRVNNLWDAQLAPRGGEHVFSGGIYRNVRLVKRSKEGGICWSGIRITTPGLEESGGQHAMVTADVETVTGSGHTRIEMVITDSDGRTVAKAQGTSSPLTAAVDTPHLWSTDTPYLYIATVRLYKGRKLLDEVRETFGFRWTRWSKEEGFFLNGRHLYLRGANVHQDQAGWGDAVTDEAARRDVRMIKEAGFNMIRGSHYPHSPAFVDECDRQGILFWSEAPFWGTAGEKRDGYWTASSYPAVAEDT
ncbi:MAG: glycoside hydrolase family 2 TIM barrel-domain containing protein, partial [Prevotellaceae bacterium]|nr:glycoside hydrolase family 2 TIM barrel-domain containing protein [Prevotellaceae bacterium]